MKFGVREICDVVLRAKARQQVGNKIFYKNEPVIYFDTLKTSSMEGVTDSPITRAQMAETRTRFAQRAEQYLAAAIAHIKANSDNYPNYTAFAGDSPEDGIIHRDNTNRKIFLA